MIRQVMIKEMVDILNRLCINTDGWSEEELKNLRYPPETQGIIKEQDRAKRAGVLLSIKKK